MHLTGNAEAISSLSGYPQTLMHSAPEERGRIKSCQDGD